MKLQNTVLVFALVVVIPELQVVVAGICTDDLVSTFRTSITSSSQFAPNDKSNNYGADRAILNTHQIKDANGVTQMGGWAAEKNNFNQWIQIDLKDPALIKGIVTQGREGGQEWVTKYRVLYSEDCHKWHTLGGFNVTDAFFTGNTDDTYPVMNMFDCPTVAKCIRVNPLGWKNNIGMRVGLLGCQLNLNGAATTTSAPTTTSTAAPIVTSTTTPAPPPTTPSTTTTTTTVKPKQTTAKPKVTQKPTPAPTTPTTTTTTTTTKPTTTTTAKPKPTVKGILPPVFVPILPVNGAGGVGTNSGTTGGITGGNNSGTNGGSGTSSGTNSGTNSGTKGSCIKSCQGLANGDYQSCIGCEVYITCVWESMFSDRVCPSGLFWDDSEKRCVLRSSTCP